MTVDPSTLDIYDNVGYQMMRAHDVYKAGYDSIVQHLADPPLSDLYNFLGYCSAWAMSIEVHHDSEEATLFPVLNQRLDFSTEIAAHKTIHSTLQEINQIINIARTDLASFNAEQLNAKMKAFRKPLFDHLDEEVSHLAREHLLVFEEAELKKMIADMEGYAMSHGDHTMVVVFLRTHTPPEHKEAWPAMPWFVRKVIIPYGLANWHRGYWKYAPYSVY